MKTEQPPACERWELTSRSTVLVVGPHQILARPDKGPLIQRLAANEWAKHVALDQASSAAGRYACNVAVDRIDAHDVGAVASRLDAQKWAAEFALKEGNPRARDSIERSARARRDQHPRAAGRVIDGQQLARTVPLDCALCRTNCYSHRRPQIIRAVHAPASNQQRWINRGVELRMRFSQIFEHDDVRVVAEELANSTARQRTPQFGWK